MTDAPGLFDLLKQYLPGASVVLIAVFAYLWSNRPQRSVAEADASGQGKAIEYLKDALGACESRAEKAEKEADEYKTRWQEAVQKTWALEKAIADLTRQVERLEAEVKHFQETKT